MSQIRRLPGPLLKAAALVAASLACGHRGDPLPPLRHTPPGLAEFRLAQRGNALEVSLLTPAASVDGIAYERLLVEILYAEGERDLEKAGARLEVLAYARQRVVETLPLPQPGTVARAAARGVVGRERGPRTLTMALVAQSPIPAPSELRARLVADGVRLTWAGDEPKPVSASVQPRGPGLPAQPPGPGLRPAAPGTPAAPPGAPLPASPARPLTPPEAGAARPPGPGGPEQAGPLVTTVEVRRAGFHVYRRAGSESYRAPLTPEPLAARDVTDGAAPLGATVCYVVRAAASVDPLVESQASNEACLEVRDVAAPAAPAGLAVLPRERGLEVLWTPAAEEDVAGYRVYRAAPGEPRAKVGDVDVARSAWLDTSARPGVVYQYSVTAIDRAGNESPEAPAVEASLP